MFANVVPSQSSLQNMDVSFFFPFHKTKKMYKTNKNINKYIKNNNENYFQKKTKQNKTNKTKQ